MSQPRFHLHIQDGNVVDAWIDLPPDMPYEDGVEDGVVWRTDPVTVTGVNQAIDVIMERWLIGGDE